MMEPALRYPRPTWSLLVLLALMLVFPSCKASRKAVAGAGSKGPVTDTLGWMIGQVDAAAFTPNWINAKLNIDFENPDTKIGVTGLLRMKPDSIIWLQVKKFGIEAARALVRRDSFFVMDRLNKTYSSGTLNELAREVDLPGDFRLIQSIFLGNAIATDAPTIKVRQVTPEWMLETKALGIFAVQRFKMLGSPRLSQLDGTQESSGLSVKVNYEDFRNVEKYPPLAYLREVLMLTEKGEKTQVKIEMQEVELDVPKSIPFEIPSHYTRM